MKAAATFVSVNPSVVPARSVLIYAWNEYDEGGWIAPMLDDGTARLDAIRAVLPR